MWQCASSCSVRVLDDLSRGRDGRTWTSECTQALLDQKGAEGLGRPTQQAGSAETRREGTSRRSVDGRGEKGWAQEPKERTEPAVSACECV